MSADLFTVLSPQSQRVPVVANLPHSGLNIPAHIAESFTAAHLQSLPNSDWHLQQLYDFLPSLGVTVLQANYSRYVVDLNRALKPPFFGSFWSAVVPEQTAFKQPIYKSGQKPTKDEIQARIEQYYTPYHRQLTTLLDEAIARYGHVYLLDLHSFMGLIKDEVCLGNANGKTCQETTIDAAVKCFERQEYQVVKNKVFSGGYITRHYGERSQIEALQIEIRYPTYLPADQVEAKTIPQWKGPNFNQAQTRLKAVISDFISTLPTDQPTE